MVDKTFIILTDVDFEIKEWFLLKLQKSEKWLIFQILTKIVFWPNFDTGLRLWLWNQRMVSSKIAILFFQIFTKFAFWPNFDIWPQEDFSFKFWQNRRKTFNILPELNLHSRQEIQARAIWQNLTWPSFSIGIDFFGSTTHWHMISTHFGALIGCHFSSIRSFPGTS